MESSRTDTLGRLLKRHGLEVDLLEKKAKLQLQQRWRESFCAELKDKTGKWVWQGADWHAFSYGYVSCLKGADAEQTFNQLIGEHFYCWSSNPALLGYLCHGQSVPKAEFFTTLLAEHADLADLFVAEKSFEWTFVVVHERALGPFFKTRNAPVQTTGGK